MQTVTLFVVLCMTISVHLALAHDCNQKYSCSLCNQEPGECRWCTHTKSCISSREVCPKFTTHFLGKLGEKLKTGKSSDIEKWESILYSCAHEVTSASQCVVGEEFAHIYLPVSKRVRNIREGGFESQPILPVTQEFLDQYLMSSGTTSKMEDYVKAFHSKDNIVAVGGFYLDRKNSSRYDVVSFDPFPNLVFHAFTADYNVKNNNTVMKVTGNRNGKVLFQVGSTNMGLLAKPGKYEIGMILALQTSSAPRPVCLFYRIPSPIAVSSIYSELFGGSMIHVGVPVYILSLLLLVGLAKSIQFTEVREPNENLWAERHKRMERDLQYESINVESIKETGYYLKPRESSWNIFRVVRVNANSIVEKSGFKGYFHWSFFKRMIILSFMFTFVALAVLMPVHIGLHREKRQYPDMSVTTSMTLAPKPNLLLIHFGFSILFYCVCSLNAFFAMKRLIFKKRVRKSMFTLQLKHLPELLLRTDLDDKGKAVISNSDEVDRREQDIAAHINLALQPFDQEIRSLQRSDKKGLGVDLLDDSSQQERKDPVLCVNILANMSSVDRELAAIYNLEQRSKEKKSNADHSFKFKPEIIEVPIAKLNRAVAYRTITSTSAFVTFRSVAALEQFVRIMKDSKKRKESRSTFSDSFSPEGTEKWRITNMDWEPEEIIWENAPVPKRSMILRTVVVYLCFIATMVIAHALIHTFVGLKGIYGLTTAIQKVRVKYLVRKHDGLPKLLRGFLYVLPAILAISAEAVGSFATAITYLEKAKTTTHMAISAFLKHSYLVFFIGMIIPLTGDLQLFKVHSYSFYNNTGLKLMEFIISQIFLSRGLKLFFESATIIYRYFRTGGYPERIHYNYTASYSHALLIFALMVLFGTRFPLVALLAFFYYIINYIEKTFLLSFYYAKSNVIGDGEYSVISTLIAIIASAGVYFAPRPDTIAMDTVTYIVVGVITSIPVSLLVFYFASRVFVKKSFINQVIHDEDRFRNKYEQPHLKMLLRREEHYEEAQYVDALEEPENQSSEQYNEGIITQDEQTVDNAADQLSHEASFPEQHPIDEEDIQL